MKAAPRYDSPGAGAAHVLQEIEMKTNFVVGEQIVPREFLQAQFSVEFLTQK